MNTDQEDVAIRILSELGQKCEERMKNAESKEEYAFLFGHVNMAAAVCSALSKSENHTYAIHISLDYDNAHKSYKKAQEFYEGFEEQYEKCRQMTFEELFPSLFKSLKKAMEKDKPTTKPKKKSEDKE